ncbi:hypothetical protein EDC40_108160 [Aminobacter aminovorans]|uniref:Uncharacterized protein n=1 Tax=Aminobacter aminovorans TaxID=83263 RepID=A0A381INI8_AMIAI|nr:hypothetical protein EDC40_108160 [Aminobacter aminovorans]SUY29487.1 Uncharacterised protein [Aminobacter aminovorans]
MTFGEGTRHWAVWARLVLGPSYASLTSSERSAAGQDCVLMEIYETHTRLAVPIGLSYTGEAVWPIKGDSGSERRPLGFLLRMSREQPSED